jgi:hypothetical protein
MKESNERVTAVMKQKEEGAGSGKGKEMQRQ